MASRLRHDLIIMISSTALGLGSALLTARETVRAQTASDRFLEAKRVETAQLNALRESAVKAMQAPWNDDNFYEFDRYLTATRPYQQDQVRAKVSAYYDLILERRKSRAERGTCIPQKIIDAYVAMTNAITAQLAE